VFFFFFFANLVYGLKSYIWLIKVGILYEDSVDHVSI